MTDVKHILVVDDHFEMLELLRSMLELSGQDYQVLAVPSAEEAMLELMRVHFDLLITDVRLPGMSGFDFVRRVKKRRADMPVIMITAYSSPQGKQEAESLGVFRYFSKPLDTDGMLTAVHIALYGEPLPPPEPEPATPVAYTVSEEVRKRLHSLRADTGAIGLLLATSEGQVILEMGEHRRLDIAKLAQTVAQNMKTSLALAEQLGEDIPFTIQYHTGKTVELYNASIGRDYFVTMLYGADARRGRIGTIWVFAQRAIRDLLALLPPLRNLPIAKPVTPVTKPTPTRKPTPTPPPDRPTPPTRTTPPPPSRTPEKPVREAPPAPPARSKFTAETAVTPPPKPAPAKPTPPKPTPLPDIPEPVFTPLTPVTDADMQGLLAALNLNDSAIPATPDLDAFWDQALGQPTVAAQSQQTLSLSEATGLIAGLALPEPTTATRPVTTESAPAPVVPGLAEADTKSEADPVDLSALLTALKQVDSVVPTNVDDFWDEASASQPSGPVRQSLSFAEALRQGLISSDIKLE